MKSYIVKIFAIFVVILIVFLSYNYLTDDSTLSDTKNLADKKNKNNEKALGEYKVNTNNSNQLNEKMNKVNKLLSTTDEQLKNLEKNSSLNKNTKQSNKQEIAKLQDELTRVKKAIKKINTEFN
ncbi:hypothetical protein [Arcobacter sp. F2176]|uniref:hypothetical protein n=1 Tax=Arcobacter sp. F2176 TaxID=2044511 RepID=UPI00100A460C|nr:hypothetical protein [Arcobacter sp. F2176]RXJ79035.1 hypothetical protein CRU95_15270 [Arcobacter sp. F2176]